MRSRPSIRRDSGRVLGSLVGGAFGCLISLVLVGIGIWNWHRTRAAESWPVTPGVVDSSSISTSYSRKGGTKYTCKVCYHFDVNGQHYTGDHLEPTGNSSGSSSTANSIKARYPAGKPCVVHYDPSDPTTCCLELGTTTGAWLFVGLGLVFGLISAFSVAKSVFPMGRM